MLCFLTDQLGNNLTWAHQRFQRVSSGLKAFNGLAKMFIFWPQELETVKYNFDRIAGMKTWLEPLTAHLFWLKPQLKTRKCSEHRRCTTQSHCKEYVTEIGIHWRFCWISRLNQWCENIPKSGFYQNVLNDKGNYFPNNEMYIIADKVYS